MDDWLQEPGNKHVLQIYRKQDDLISKMTAYIGQGLRNDESCIVIATTEHILQLETKLRYTVDLNRAASSGQYVVIDAERALKHFLINGMPDETVFRMTVGRLLRDLSADSQGMRPIRVFGEMVALLWRDGNTPAVLKLENMWNRLSQEVNFSLLCSYPELHFMFDRNVRHQVARRHDMQLGVTR